MDNSKQATDADNHNTNQNEAACINRSVLMTDQFPDARFLAEATLPSQNLDLDLEVNVKTETSFYTTVPTVIITPASPSSHDRQLLEDGGSEYESFSKSIEQNSSNPLIGNSQDACGQVQNLIDLDLLHTPSNDTTLNIARPPSCGVDGSHSVAMNVSRPSSSGGEVTCGIDTTTEDDNEVICRYSSTPVMSSSRNRQSLTDTDCSMLSINNASPIAPNDSVVSTPDLSTHRSLSQEEESAEDKSSGCQDHQNIMYVNPQCLLQNNNQAMMRRDVPTSQNTQSPYVNGRVVNQGYLPSTSFSTGVYPSSQNIYSTYMQGCGGYNDYFPTRESSWTDLSYRSDTSPVPPLAGPLTESCCYPVTAAGSPETEYFVYPSIYVSSSGLISVLLRNDMSVEMTVDRTIRVVSHNHMMAVATDSRGTAACLYHPAVKVFQIGTTTDIATPNFRARMGGGDAIVFSNGVNFFKLEDSELQPTAPIKFTDILRDQSVNLLFSSEGYGESLVASCMQVAAQAEYANLPKGGVIVRINGVKVTQTGSGDVTVVTGAKFIRLSPHFGTTRLGNRFVDIEVEKDWTVKLTRGSHSFVYSKKTAMVCNGKMEAGFDENNGLKVTNLQIRLPLLAEPSIVRRQCRKPMRVPSTNGTLKRRPGPTGSGRGGGGGGGGMP